MSKLFKLKEWLTVPEAAKHLSVLFGEEVAESDVLRLGLDGHLKLSVNFVNEAMAYKGKVVPISEAKLVEGFPISDALRESFAKQIGVESCVGEQAIENGDTKFLVMLGYRLSDKQIVQFDDEKKYLRGVWDLCMLEGERHDVEELYYEEIGAPFVDRWSLEGVLVTKSDGYIYRLAYELEKPNKETFDKTTEIARANLMKGACRDEAEIQRAVEEHAQYRKKLWEDKTPRYGTASHLPDDSLLVVRTDALREFEQSINGNSSSSSMPLATMERNTLLRQIGALSLALAEQSKKYKRGEKPNGLQIANFAGEIVDALPGANTAGLGVSSVRESIRQGIELLTAIQQ